MFQGRKIYEQGNVDYFLLGSGDVARVTSWEDSERVEFLRPLEVFERFVTRNHMVTGYDVLECLGTPVALYRERNGEGDEVEFFLLPNGDVGRLITYSDGERERLELLRVSERLDTNHSPDCNELLNARCVISEDETVRFF